MPLIATVSFDVRRRSARLGSALGPYTRKIGVKGFICIFGTFIGRVIDGVMAERTAFAKEER